MQNYYCIQTVVFYSGDIWLQLRTEEIYEVFHDSDLILTDGGVRRGESSNVFWQSLFVLCENPCTWFDGRVTETSE